MKKSQLRNIIRESIEKLMLNENIICGMWPGTNPPPPGGCPAGQVWEGYPNCECVQAPPPPPQGYNCVNGNCIPSPTQWASQFPTLAACQAQCQPPSQGQPKKVYYRNCHGPNIGQPMSNVFSERMLIDGMTPQIGDTFKMVDPSTNTSYAPNQKFKVVHTSTPCMESIFFPFCKERNYQKVDCKSAPDNPILHAKVTPKDVGDLDMGDTKTHSPSDKK
tara:strand:- start:15 stop:671 length:657 start_codon:yes stop_codon:yes gene_type:complete